MNTSTSHKTPATTTNGLRRSFGPDGCQAVIDGARCGETKNLQIIKEFKRMYEDKMKQIDDIAGGDCIQAKVNLQQEWIKDLTDQNEMLVRVVEELEVEAAERVTLLERKLQQTAKSAGEKLEQVQNDMNNLLELIRRAQKDGKWDTDGLKFYSFDVRDLIKLDQPGALVVPRDNNSKQKDDIVKDKERLIKELEAQLKPYIDSGKSPKDYDSMKKGYKDLEQSMLDMRDALTAEVADKHDTVLCLRREVHLLEEQCRKADQQTHFKDDIIKELRKEIKQLRQQQSTQAPHEHQNENQNGKLKEALLDAKNQLASMKELADTNAKERDNLKKELDDGNKKLDDANKKLDDANKKLDDFKTDQTGEVKELKEKLQACLDEVRKLQGENLQETEKLKELLQDQSAENRSLQEQRNEETKSLQDHLDTYKQELDNLRKEKEQEIKALQDKLDACKAELEAIQKGQITDTSNLRKQLEAAKAEIDDLKKKGEETKSLRDKLNACREELDAIKKGQEQETKALQDKLNACKEEMESLKKGELTNTDNLKKQLDAAKAETDGLKKKLTDTDNLKKQLDAANAKMDDLKKKSADNKDLEDKQAAKVEQLKQEKMSPEIEAKQKIAKLEEQLRAALKQKEQAIEYERNRRTQEVENLKLTIQHMESVLKNKQVNSENLQCAVDLYSDSVTVLEESKEHYETEIAQQQVTIANLQDALVITKRELEELRTKFKQDHDHKCDLLNILDIGVQDLETMCLNYYDQLTCLRDAVECLHDENLNLEVARNELIQDTAILESRLLKYQQEERRLSEFVLNLKEEISRLKYENQADALKIAGLKNNIGFYINQAVEMKKIMRHILGIGDCEDPICNDDTTEDLVATAHDIENFVHSLQSQINLMLASMEREQQMNQVNASRIDELQNILSLKNMELNRSIEMYQDLKVKLEGCAVRNKKLEEAVFELQEQLKDTELDQQFQDKKVDMCHDELDMCLNNLNCVKMKLRQQCQMMTQKIHELTELKADFKDQNSNLEMYKRDLESTKARYRDEVSELKRAIRELTDKCKCSELRADELNEELKNVQDIVMNMTQRENKLQQDLATKDQDFSNKLQVWKVKEARLLEQISQLEQQLHAVHNELTGRTHQIDCAKNKLQQISNDANMRVQMGQEELLAARNEINLLRKVHEKLQIENDSLQQTVHSLQATLAHNDSLNITVKKELDKCIMDLKKIETDKYFVEQMNEKLLQKLDKMQGTLRSRCENMVTLEEELNETKTDRDQIRKESQHVVCNVRAWLEEQKKVNDQLKDKLLKKNALIIKYQQASSSNMDVINRQSPNAKKNLPPVCAEVCNRRQRGGTVSSGIFNTCNDITADSTELWSLNSRGSDSDRPRSSVGSDSAEWFDMDASEATAPCDEPGTQVWIQRVESMTKELERTSRYWKRKISDSEFMVTRDK